MKKAKIYTVTSVKGGTGKTTTLLNLAATYAVNGKRTLPAYVDEHDWINDLTSVTTDGKAINKSKTTYLIILFIYSSYPLTAPPVTPST